jgi:hypothetical protein
MRYRAVVILMCGLSSLCWVGETVAQELRLQPFTYQEGFERECPLVVPENSYILTHNGLSGSVPFGGCAGICDNLRAVTVI